MTQFNPTSRRLRSFFACVALTATVANGAFIDWLATTYSVEGQQAANATPVVVVAAQR